MMSFEVEYGFEQAKPVQFKDLDQPLRNLLWNLHEELFNAICPPRRFEHDEKILNFLLEDYWKEYFKESIHTFSFPDRIHLRIDQIRAQYFNRPGYKVYTFLMFTAKWLKDFMPDKHHGFKENCNTYLEQENSAWRFVGDVIAPFNSAIEIEEIEIASAVMDEAAVHLKSATILLANGENDQSRESIAQSISAVEAAAKKKTGNTKATLAELCQHSKILPTNSQLRTALHKLYNYTSGKDGIRHALTEVSEPVTPEVARFMLVVCSAFVNLIRSESVVQLQ